MGTGDQIVVTSTQMAMASSITLRLRQKATIAHPLEPIRTMTAWTTITTRITAV